MQGKTHFMIGTAAALFILQPSELPVLVAGGAAAGLGSVISDIDAGRSSAGAEAVKVIAVSVMLSVSVILADMYLNLGIYEKLILRGSSHSAAVTPVLLFLLLCSFGMLTPHRSFMHSFPAMLLLGGCMYLLAPGLALYFVIGFASHILLDLLNKKGERLFYPFRKGFALRFCHADGKINSLLLAVGTTALVIAVYTSIPVQQTMQLVHNGVPLQEAMDLIRSGASVELIVGEVSRMGPLRFTEYLMKILHFVTDSSQLGFII
ncbi:MAG: metal-dependent hydrolase [Lachnospiraceae bacterium]|nr:metal-dependent hydrolase [Lachnospiraceae bacterium]